MMHDLMLTIYEIIADVLKLQFIMQITAHIGQMFTYCTYTKCCWQPSLAAKATVVDTNNQRPNVQTSFGTIITTVGKSSLQFILLLCFYLQIILRSYFKRVSKKKKTFSDLNTLRTESFKLFKRPFPGFLTILTL